MGGPSAPSPAAGGSLPPGAAGSAPPEGAIPTPMLTGLSSAQTQDGTAASSKAKQAKLQWRLSEAIWGRGA
eukprot:14845562-Alexandrium_andersonii.AAC.1